MSFPVMPEIVGRTVVSIGVDVVDIDRMRRIVDRQQSDRPIAGHLMETRKDAVGSRRTAGDQFDPQFADVLGKVAFESGPVLFRDRHHDPSHPPMGTQPSRGHEP